MNYCNEILKKISEDENYSKIKDYSKENHKVKTYFGIGKLLHEAGKHYGENIIGKYAIIIQEKGKKYNERTLRRYRQFYLRFNNIKWSQVATELSWSHYSELISIDDDLKVKYYINQCITLKLSRNELRNKIKQQEYERLSEYAKQKIDKEDKTIGIIICKKDNHFIMEYCSDKRILSREYQLG